MIKVLIVATTSYAGMGPYVTSIYNTFRPTDNVFFLGLEYAEEYFRKNIKEELLPMCTFYRQANTHWNTLKKMFFPDRKFDKIVLNLCKNNSITVVHYINGPIHTSMIRNLHKMGIRTIGTIHDLHPHEANKVWYKMFRHWVEARKLTRSIETSDNFLTNSLAQLSELKSLFPKKHSYYVSFPSLVTASIINGSLTPQELHSISKPYILFFGLIEEYKGIDILLKAYSSSLEIQNKYSLVIAGRGELKENWRTYRGVYFINRYIKDEEVRALYEKASMVVYPYISATQSGVLSLSFYFGTPTIVSDVPYFKSLVETNGAGELFERGNHESLIRSILTIDSKKGLIQAQKEYYMNNYDNKSIRESLLSVYNSIYSLG